MEEKLTRQEIESCEWNHQMSSVDKSGISWESYKIIKKYPNIIWAEPMGQYWEMKIGGQIQWEKWKQYPIEITETKWGGFAGTTNTQRIYRGDIPTVTDLRILMRWLGIDNKEE